MTQGISRINDINQRIILLMTGIDGNVNGLNRDVFTALQKVKDPKKYQ
jgi:hypothetical protein